MDEEDRDAVRGSHSRDRGRSGGCAAAVRAVRLRGNRTTRRNIDDHRAVDLPENRRSGVPKPRGVQERGAPGTHLRIRAVGGPQIEGRAAVGPPRAERMRHPRDRIERSAPKELDA